MFYLTKLKACFVGVVWVEFAATSKLIAPPHSWHQRCWTILMVEICMLQYLDLSYICMFYTYYMWQCTCRIIIVLNYWHTDGLHYKVRVFQRLLDHAHRLKSACLCLEAAFEQYIPTPDLNCEPTNNTSHYRCQNIIRRRSMGKYNNLTLYKTHHTKLYYTHTIIWR